MYIQNEDLSEIVEISIKGENHHVLRAESLIYWYLNNGSRIRVAFYNSNIIGFFIYQDYLSDVIAGRVLYVKPEHRSKSVSRALFDEIIKNKSVIFQTRKDKTPQEMLSKMSTERMQIAESEKLITTRS